MSPRPFAATRRWLSSASIACTWTGPPTAAAADPERACVLLPKRAGQPSAVHPLDGSPNPLFRSGNRALRPQREPRTIPLPWRARSRAHRAAYRSGTAVRAHSTLSTRRRRFAVRRAFAEWFHWQSICPSHALVIQARFVCPTRPMSVLPQLGRDRLVHSQSAVARSAYDRTSRMLQDQGWSAPMAASIELRGRSAIVSDDLHALQGVGGEIRPNRLATITACI